MSDLVSLRDIHYRYPGRPDALLSGATLTLAPGERLGLLGDNGSGKSTLLHIGAGLIRPASGTVTVDDAICRTEKDFAAARQRIGYLLQRPEDQLFCPSVLEDVAFGPYNHGASASEAEALARSMLAELELEHLAPCSGSRLSGGEQKLAALAAVLVMRPAFLFLDEPTNDLDAKARERLLRILLQRNLPAVVISHDAEFLSALCTSACLLRDGVIHPANKP